MKSVNGRFQTLQASNKGTVVIDYAHTPDALENILTTLSTIRTRNESLITIVGCGGNRDQEKRPLMAEVAVRYSDKVIFTSDNPRNEDPAVIISEMMKGCTSRALQKGIKSDTSRRGNRYGWTISARRRYCTYCRKRS